MTVAVDIAAIALYAAVLIVDLGLLALCLRLIDRGVVRHPNQRGLFLILAIFLGAFVFGLLPPLIASPDRATSAQRHRGNVEAAISLVLCWVALSAWIAYRYVYTQLRTTRSQSAKRPH